MNLTIRESTHAGGDTGRHKREPLPRRRKSLGTVDVVIPCYNYGHYLKTCVSSVLSQASVEVRVLIIDDASSDDTEEVGDSLAAADSRVNFRRHRVNKGHIATYNEGLVDWSEADYTVLLSADDILAPDSLSRAVDIMEADDRIGMVYGRAIHFKEETELPVPHTRKFALRRWTGAEWLEGRCRAGHNVITSPEVVVRGSVQRRVGGYCPDLPHAGDLEMWLRIAAVSDIAYIRRTPQAYYRVHESSMMRTVHRGSFLDLRQRKLVFDKFYQRHRQVLPDAERLYELANRALAREALWDACRAYDRNELETAHAAELVEFAMRTYAATDTLSEYSALRRRRALGPLICNRTQVFAVPALVRKIRRWVLRERWKRHGV